MISGLSAALCVFALAFATPISVAEDASEQHSTIVDHRLVDANNQFAIKLYRQIAAAEDGNVFLSPFSIAEAFGVAQQGARNQTGAEMSDALGNHVVWRSNSTLADIRKALEVESEGVTLKIANALWIQQGFNIKVNFLERVAAAYGASINLVDFLKAPDAAVDTINSWVAERTNDKVPQLVSPDSITEYTRLVITNAVYFNGKWLEPFSANATYDGEFLNIDGDHVPVNFMRVKRHAPYYENDVLKATEFDYRGRDFSMVVLLPKEDIGIEAVEQFLNYDALDLVLRRMDASKPFLLSGVFPRVEFEGEFELSEPMQALGVVSAFDEKSADFGGISDDEDLHISGAIHKTFLSIGETGTEAAAATAIYMEVVSAMRRDREARFDANRPFIVLIRHIPTNAIVFLGRVADIPEASFSPTPKFDRNAVFGK